MVHGLKGASYGICAETIGGEAEELEFAAKAGDYEKVESKNTAFIAEVEAALEQLGELLKTAAETGKAKQKADAPDRDLLEKLLDASKHFKPAVMEEIMAELEKYEYQSEEDLIPWLREQIDNLEYDAVREKLETLVS
jgi:LPS O-antigen subunit length determinant protein (WzzB/FepE family)